MIRRATVGAGRWSLGITFELPPGMYWEVE